MSGPAFHSIFHSYAKKLFLQLHLLVFSIVFPMVFQKTWVSTFRPATKSSSQVRSLIRPDFCPSVSGFFMVGSAFSVIQQSCLGFLVLLRRGLMMDIN
jgi:hypothetical protein